MGSEAGVEDSTVNTINADADEVDTLPIRLVSTYQSMEGKCRTLLSGTLRLVLSVKVRWRSHMISRPKIHDEEPRSCKPM